MFQKMMQAKQDITEYEFLGIDRIFGYTPIPGTNWSIAVGADKVDVYAQKCSTMRMNIALIAFCFLPCGS
jgi:methyl-accepting chemotaxis protein